MDLIKAINGRRSIQAFKPVPVKELIENILNLVIRRLLQSTYNHGSLLFTMGKEKERS